MNQTNQFKSILRAVQTVSPDNRTREFLSRIRAQLAAQRSTLALLESRMHEAVEKVTAGR